MVASRMGFSFAYECDGEFRCQGVGLPPTDAGVGIIAAAGAEPVLGRGIKLFLRARLSGVKARSPAVRACGVVGEARTA